MPSSLPLHGVIPIIPTPFRADESVDLDGLADCVRFAATRGFHAVCLPAYASEFYKLSESERLQLVETAVAAAGENMGVVAQSNHPSAKLAAQLAQRHQSLGASAISFALPRQFALTEQDLFDYARRICEATPLPVLVQDFYPGGQAVGPEFARRLHEACPNFRYLKLEEPLLGPKVRSIIQATEGRVGVLEGWGGMYMMELMRDGICGVMPGLGCADFLQRVWYQVYDGNYESAMDTFQIVLPQIVYTLQNLETWLFAEKRLLAARGILAESSCFVRAAARTPHPTEIRHIFWLNDRLVRQARILGLDAGTRSATTEPQASLK